MFSRGKPIKAKRNCLSAFASTVMEVQKMGNRLMADAEVLLLKVYIQRAPSHPLNPVTTVSCYTITCYFLFKVITDEGKC